METNLVKSGEMAVQLSLRRTKSEGLQLHVKVHPSIEQFMRQQSGNGLQQTRMSDYGGSWRSREELFVYEFNDSIVGHTYNLMQVGLPLESSVRDPGSSSSKRSVANLSFLRFVGASEPNGVTINIHSLHSYEQLKAINEIMQKALSAFYRDYLMPIDLTLRLTTSSQETRL